MKQDVFSSAPPIIKEFLGYLGTVKGKSPLTVEEYFLDLRTFFRYMLQQRGDVSPQTPFDEINISSINLTFIESITLTACRASSKLLSGKIDSANSCKETAVPRQSLNIWQNGT